MADVDALADSVFKAVESYLARSLEDFTERMDAVITARIEALPKPKDGENGKDADLAELAAVKASNADALAKVAALEKQMAEFPTPKDGSPGKDGEPGKDGVSVDPEAIALMVTKAVAEIEAPAGPPGLNGKDAIVDYEKIAEDIAKAIGELPKPKDGVNGKDAVLDYDKINEAIEANFEEVVKELPKSPTSFVIDDAGDLVSIYPDGTTKSIGMVRGKDGARGATVADARIDEAGQLILRMTDQRNVICGGVRGKDGKDGLGMPGKPGRDANEVRPIPAIDESKSYPEGTYAEYRGGEIRAERTTDPIIDGDVLKAGWRVARVGIAEETEQLIDDGRIIECTTVYTSGYAFVRRRMTKSIIYRGVWKEGEFVPGDVVTWDGGMWHCERATNERPGGLTGVRDWKLCVKRGSPGKDASNGVKH